VLELVGESPDAAEPEGDPRLALYSTAYVSS
jgi:hypothetical protein